MERGGWLAQSVKHMTFDLGVISSSPTLGVELTKKKKRFHGKRIAESRACSFQLLNLSVLQFLHREVRVVTMQVL